MIPRFCSKDPAKGLVNLLLIPIDKRNEWDIDRIWLLPPFDRLLQ